MEGTRIVGGKSAHVTRVDTGDLTDMRRDRFGFAAHVMRLSSTRTSDVNP